MRSRSARRFIVRRSPYRMIPPLVVLVVVAIRVTWFPVGSPISKAIRMEEGFYRVIRVEDDGLIALAPDDEHTMAHLDQGPYLIALLGIHPNRGAVVAQAVREIVGDRILLRLDRTRIDLDGQMVGYVFCNETFLNAELVKRGIAHAVSNPGDSQPMCKILRQAEEEARFNALGVWRTTADLSPP